MTMFLVKSVETRESSVVYSRDGVIEMMLHFTEGEYTGEELEAMDDTQLCNEFNNAIIDFGFERGALEGANDDYTNSTLDVEMVAE